tara:strand:- start:1696 stop:6339 length:4644 start_codon:yes stop_codon:yes gene_type:complete
MVESFIELSEPTDVETFVDLSESSEPVPIQDAELTATIATLAIKNLNGLPADQAKNKYDQYYDLALQREEDLIRSELVNLKIEKFSSLSNDALSEALFNSDSETAKGILDLQFAFNVEEEKFTIIENEAATQIVAEGSTDSDRANHSLEDLELDTQSFEDVVQNTLTEQLLMSKVQKKYLNKLGWNWETVGQAAAMLIPLEDMMIMSQRIKTSTNDILTGNDLKEQVATFKAMSVPEKAKTLEKLQEFFDKEAGTVTLSELVQGSGNDLAALTYFMYLNEFTLFDQSIENGIHILDGTIVGSMLSKPVGAILKTAGIAGKLSQALMKGKIAAASIIAGNRSSAISQVHSTLNGVRSGEVAIDSNIAANAGDILLEGQLQPIPDIIKGSVGISGRLEKDLQIIDGVAQEVLNTQQVRFLDVNETEEVLSVYREMVATEMMDQGVHHADILKSVTDEITQGLEGTKYSVYYGDAFGTGFSSEKVANEYAGFLGLDGATVTSKEIDGTHFLRLDKVIDNPSGYIQVYKGIDNPALIAAGGWRRVMGSPTNYIGTLEARSAHLTLATREIGSVSARKMMNFVTKLSSKDKAQLAEVMEDGRNKEKWFSINELTNRFSLNDKQIAAYTSLRRMDDINHVILNSSEYNRKGRQGFKTIELTNKTAIEKGLDTLFDAKPIQTIVNPQNKSIYDVSKGEYVKDLTQVGLEDLKKRGYILTELEGARETDVLEPIQYLIGQTSDLRIKPLKYNQVEYKAGGRVEYQDEWFVKQGRIRRRDGNPVPILLKSRTLGIGNEAEAAGYVVKMNRGREVALANIGQDGKMATSVQSDKQIHEATEGLFHTIRAFVDYVGRKDLTTPFEAVKDSQELTAVRQAIGEGANAHPSDLAEVNSVQRLISRNGNQKSKRGERLRAFNGNPAPVVNPIESATKSLDRALSLMSLETWKARQAEKFYKTFASVLEGNKSSTAHMKNPEWIKNPSKELAPLLARGERMHEHFKVILNTPTSGDRFIKNNLVDPMVDIFNWASNKVGKPLKTNTIDNLKSMNPVGFVRSLSYHSNLGLFNLKQPAIQAQATLLMMAANPKNGAKAAWLGGPMRLMLASENSKTLGNIAKAAGKVVGISGKEVEELYEILQKTGTWRMTSGGLAEQELKGLSSASLFQKALDVGTIPFLETERYNKVSATMSAALDWKEANPAGKITEAVIDEIRTRSEFYTANMNRVDRATWQTGLAAMPTQFWGYQARALEMMLPQIAGGSKNFTGWQKVRMTVAQLGLYGVGGATSPKFGLRFRDTFAEMYQERFKEELPKPVGDALEFGMVESVLANAFGVDVAFSHRAGLGLTEGGWGEVITKLASFDTDEILTIDAAGMSTLGKASTGFYNLIRLINPSSEYFGTIEQLDAFTAVAKDTARNTFASYKGIERAYIAATMGIHVNKFGNTTDRASTTMETVLGLLGLDPSNERDERAMTEALKGGKTFRESTVRILGRELNMAMRNGDFDNFIGTRKFLFSILNEQERRDINKSILSKTKNSTQSIITKYYQVHGVNRNLFDPKGK